jgi:hypothetical protein
MDSAPSSEALTASVAHYAQRLIHRTTGMAYSVDELVGLLGGNTVPVAVANAEARKLPATYVTAEVVPYIGMQVIQSDQPLVLWILLNTADITSNANWAGVPMTDATGVLGLSGVKLNDGNVPFDFARYIPVSSSNWLPSASAKYMRLVTGITIPASLVVAGNKIAVTGTVRGRKDTTGANTQIALTFQQASLFDFIAANPSTTEDANIPIVGIVDSASTLEWEGTFHAIFTLTAVTGTPSQLRLVADTQLTDGGKIWSFTGSAYAALGNPSADAVDSAGLETNIPSGADLEIVVGVRGAANAHNKIHQVAISGGVNVFVP